MQTIESIVAPQIGLGALDAACDAPDGLGFGDTFDCTAVTGDGEEILFRATIEDGAVVSMQSLNLLTTDIVGAVEVAVSDELVLTHSLDVDPGAVDCGDEPVVYRPGEVLPVECRILHPETGRPHAAHVEIFDLVSFALTVTVDDQPL